MKASYVLLRHVVRWGLNAAGFGVAGELLEAGMDLLANEHGNWREGKEKERRRAEAQEMVQASVADALAVFHSTLDELRQSQRDIEQRLEGKLGKDAVVLLANWASQIPAVARQAMRRPEDPSGMTVRAELEVEHPQDLLRLIPTRLPRFAPGQRPLANVDWELVELLGLGGFAEVWKARHVVDHEHFRALKFCRDEQGRDLWREAELNLLRLRRDARHEGLVRLEETYLHADPPCLAYEFVTGGDLGGLIAARRSGGGDGLPPHEAAALMLELVEPVAHLHALDPPLVHRDLKPANILIQPLAGGQRRLKVHDLGIGASAAARTISETQRGVTSAQFTAATVCGAYTPIYASPQQKRGERPDPRDDVHALGVIWWQALCGDPAREAPSGRHWPRRLAERGMAAQMINLLHDCLSSEPDERPPDAAALMDRLCMMVSGPAHAPSAAPQVETRSPTRPSAHGTSAAAPGSDEAAVRRPGPGGRSRRAPSKNIHEIIDRLAAEEEHP